MNDFLVFFIALKTHNVISNGLKMTYFWREPLDTSLENNIMQHICESYEFFDVFFKFISRLFLKYFRNIVGISNDKRCTLGYF
jgi:hypothetical protein